MTHQTADKPYRSPPVGLRYAVVLYGVDESWFEKIEKFQRVVRAGLRKDGLTAKGSRLKKFGDKAWTWVVVLSESHFATHTYLEYKVSETDAKEGTMAIEVYSCLGPESGKETCLHVARTIGCRFALVMETPVPIDFEQAVRQVLASRPKYFLLKGSTTKPLKRSELHEILRQIEAAKPPRDE